MVRTALLILVIELVVIGLVRRRDGARAESGPPPPRSGFGEVSQERG